MWSLLLLPMHVGHDSYVSCGCEFFRRYLRSVSARNLEEQGVLFRLPSPKQDLEISRSSSGDRQDRA